MAKSSSSSKRKRPKDSSKVRTKKKSKIKRSGLKKLRRRDDSDSYFSDDSGRSVSISSSSEDSYRRRRSQSRTHKAVKESRRRARSLSSSSEEESHRMTKRKRSKRNDDSVMKKKNFRSKKKKKKDREASISSRSRGPCCSPRSSSSSESEHESRRGRSVRKEKRIRKLKNVNSEAARRRYRSRSCSPCSINDESSDHSSKEKVIDGNNSKRLKSVIIVTKDDDEEEEERELYMNEDKEQTICDHDDYPSSRSNDSVDGDDHRAISKPASVGPMNNDSTEGKSSKISDAADNVDANDLESILRQKALENLKRFRGKSNDDTLKSLSTKKAEVNQIASINDDGLPAAKGDSAHLLRKEENDFDRNSGGNDSVSSMNDIHVTDEMAVAGREKINMYLNPVSNRPRLVRSALKQALLNATTTKIKSLASPETSKPKLMTESSISEHDATLLQGGDNNEDANNASGFGSSVNSSRLTSAVVDMNKLQDEGQLGLQLQKLVSSPTPRSSTSNEFTVNTTAGSTSAEQSSSASKKQDDDKEGSQLEQKTMSVMRGGEMVQVSYKVYVPKKAPGLARRQLKR